MLNNKKDSLNHNKLLVLKYKKKVNGITKIIMKKKTKSQQTQSQYTQIQKHTINFRKVAKLMGS